MKIFLICPVRNIPQSYADDMELQVKHLEAQGHSVYWPSRDTNQNEGELTICMQNRTAIEQADAIYVIWDGKSQGVLFDLGMAFALRKPLTIVNIPISGDGKSFTRLMCTWEEGNEQDSLAGQ